MRKPTLPNAIHLIITGILLILVFVLLYLNQADAMTDIDRWNTMPGDMKRNELVVDCIVRSKTFGEPSDNAATIEACTQSALQVIPLEIIE